MKKTRKERRRIRTAVLTLRMSPEEMLRFRLAALTLGKKRGRIVRERLADLIGGTLPMGTGVGEATVATGVPSTNPPAGGTV